MNNLSDLEDQLAQELSKIILEEIDNEIIEELTGIKTHIEDAPGSNYAHHYQNFTITDVRFVTVLIPPDKSLGSINSIPLLEISTDSVKITISQSHIQLNYSLFFGNQVSSIRLEKKSKHAGMSYAEIRSFIITAVEDHLQRTISDITNWTITE